MVLDAIEQALWTRQLVERVVRELE